jgi:hypothetical protein
VLGGVLEPVTGRGVASFSPTIARKDSAMSHTQHASKRRRRSKALPVLGAAGLSLSLASGASAVPSGPAVDTLTPNTTEVSQQITLGEEEISDVTLASFYVFDKENDGTSGPLQLAKHGGGCGGHGHGCGGCGGHGHGCGGCGGHGHGCGGCGGHGHGCGGCGGHRHGCWGGCVGIGIGCGGCGGCGGGGYWCWINGVRTWCPYPYDY